MPKNQDSLSNHPGKLEKRFDNSATSANSNYEISQKKNLDPRYMQRIVKYAVLTPGVVEAILYDQIPDGLVAKNLTNMNIPAAWQAQRVVFRMV